MMAVGLDQLRTAPKGTMHKMTDFMICQGRKPESLEELGNHIAECPRCTQEDASREAAVRERRYFNEHGSWSPDYDPDIDDVC